MKDFEIKVSKMLCDVETIRLIPQKRETGPEYSEEYCRKRGYWHVFRKPHVRLSSLREGRFGNGHETEEDVNDIVSRLNDRLDEDYAIYCYYHDSFDFDFYIRKVGGIGKCNVFDREHFIGTLDYIPLFE